MTRFINAASFRQTLEEEKKFHRDCDNREIIQGLEIAIADLSDEPTVDVRPNIYAYWIHTIRASGSERERYYACSYCKEHADRSTPFCPQCGSWMNQPMQDAVVLT